MNHSIRKNSKKRDAILALLRSTKEHPSAEWVYAHLKPKFPDISLGTVYRNLSMFKDDGEIISVGSFGGQDRFDANAVPHPHFVCDRCHCVIDVDSSFAPKSEFNELEEAIGCKISGTWLYFSGLCDKCLEERQASSL